MAFTFENYNLLQINFVKMVYSLMSTYDYFSLSVRYPTYRPPPPPPKRQEY